MPISRINVKLKKLSLIKLDIQRLQVSLLRGDPSVLFFSKIHDRSETACKVSPCVIVSRMKIQDLKT